MSGETTNAATGSSRTFGDVLGDFLNGGAHFLSAGGHRLQVAVDPFCGGPNLN